MRNKENYLQENFEIAPGTTAFVDRIAKKNEKILNAMDKMAEMHQYRVIKAMQNAGLAEHHFNGTTGYGYDDMGRDALEAIYAEVFGGEDALVRPHIASGTHAIALCLYGILRPGDELLSITGKPYDTIVSVIGSENNEKDEGTLRDLGVHYRQVELTESGDIDIQAALSHLNEKTKMVYMQRSKGYSWRKALTISDIEKAVALIKKAAPKVKIFIDNCYGEFLDTKEPPHVGVDLIAGSLIKNPGGGIAPTGGYVVGKKDCVMQAAARLSAPGIAKEVGATLGVNRILMMGLFLAPTVVAQAIKTAILMAASYRELGYEVCPSVEDYRSDIIQSIQFGVPEAVTTFCKAVQEAAPVDSYVTPEPWDMPGYTCPVIMAAGAFIQGSSIELSADAPMREPYIAYFQGGLTHYHGKLGLLLTLERLKQAGLLKNKEKLENVK
ncbi:MAG: hypothetical protein GX127_04590 [Eubacteriaceae bacterium]|jgi:cystathionine beta-lyase family protein involved in aluminum resistance|nr:hypothetical protein [Eubacteriaceae bacterium]